MALIQFLVGLLCLKFSSGWLALESDVPMGHSLVELRIRKEQPPPLRTDIEKSHRLPKSVKPIHYDLEIRPIMDWYDPHRHTAPGRVTIRIKCLQATSSIVLHARYLDISFQGIRITSVDDAVPVRVTGFNKDDDERAFFTLFVDRDLTVDGEYLIRIPFTATIANPDVRQSGIYRSSYRGSDGSWKVLAVTQFQKAYARETFPCFDEPSYQFKAKFTLKIGRQRDFISLSNMEKVGEPEPILGLEGWFWDNYATSVHMPVYTLGFAITSDYHSQDSSNTKLPIKTWIPKASLTPSNVNFTVEVSSQIINYYEEIFDLPYQLKKMDNFAANMDLWAMENWGLVVYRPGFLTWSEDENTQFEKWISASLIAHEYVHMWFGNLVTCEYWNDFWLQEGMARYFQFVGAQYAADGFRPMERYVIDLTQWAMAFDEGPQSVPVHTNITDRVTYQPFQIEYDKAGALIRMMQTFLTADTFYKSLRTYLRRHQFNNTVQEDLFQAMTEQGNEDGTFNQYTVKEVMDSWTNLKGFPIIRVSRADSITIYLSQHRFITHPSPVSPEPGLWYVPIWFITKSHPFFNGNSTIPDFWMDKDTVISYFHVDDTNEWIIVNPEARGYYRVIYDDHLTNLIMAQLESNHLVFDCQTRSQLFDDYFRSAQARYISIKYAMDLTWYLPKEDDVIVWTSVLNNFRNIYTRIVDSNIITLFKKYMYRLIIPPLQRIGLKQLPTDNPSRVILRGQLVDWACALEHELCGKIANDYFADWMGNNSTRNPIPVDLQPQVYCSAVALSKNMEVHQFLLQHYQKTNSYRQRNLVVRALACDKTKEFLQPLLLRAVQLNDTQINVRTHGSVLLESLLRNSFGRNLTWQYVKKNYREIYRVHGEWAVPRIVNGLVAYASSKGNAKLDTEIVSFISIYLRQRNMTNAKIDTYLQSAAERIVENSYWMEYYFSDMKEWLTLHVNK